MTVSAGTTRGLGGGGGGVGSFATEEAEPPEAGVAAGSGEDDDDCWSADFWQPKTVKVSAKQTRDNFADRGRRRFMHYLHF
jgi:hypothetical protein